MENDILLSPIRLNELLSDVRAVIKEELAALQSQQQEKLLSPAETCKLFEPSISKVTLSKWTADGLIPSQKIGNRVWYKQSDVIEAGTRLKKFKAK